MVSFTYIDWPNWANYCRGQVEQTLFVAKVCFLNFRLDELNPYYLKMFGKAYQCRLI